MNWHPAKLVVAIPLAIIAAFLAWYGGFIISKVFAETRTALTPRI